MKYLIGLSHNTKPLSYSTGKRANVLLKGHLGIKGYPQYNKVSRLLLCCIYSEFNLQGSCAVPMLYPSI